MRGGMAYSQYSALIPRELKEKAIQEGVCIAHVLTRALEEELKNRDDMP